MLVNRCKKTIMNKRMVQLSFVNKFLVPFNMLFLLLKNIQIYYMRTKRKCYSNIIRKIVARINRYPGDDFSKLSFLESLLPLFIKKTPPFIPPKINMD